MRYALKLLNVIVETCKGKIDEVVKEILGFLITEISQNNVRNSYKMALLESVSYNRIILINFFLCV
jgi:hypothetical protein